MNIKKNFFYSCILTVSNYIFPLITYPYISRVLGVEKIGICNYVDSIINYYLYFAMLGISFVGVREIAAVKENKLALKNTFVNLILLNGITTLIAVVVLILSIYLLPALSLYRELLWIGVVKLLGHFFLIDWFYKGVEDFKYITNRTILVKLLYVLSVFLFVKNEESYIVYFLLTALLIFINALFNICHIGKYLQSTVQVVLKLSCYIKSYSVMGVYIILSSMYITYNVIYLGGSTNAVEVGYYTTATKLLMIILAIYTSFTSVMLPRMSNLLSNNNTRDFRSAIIKSVDVLLLIAVPLTLFCCIMKHEIVYIISGPGYMGAELPFAIVSLLIFLSGYNQLQVIQILMPLNKDKSIFVCSFLASVGGVVLNSLFVKNMGAIGSAIVFLLCELIVFFIAMIFVKRYIQFTFPFKKVAQYILVYSPYIIIALMLSNLISNSTITYFFVQLALVSVYTLLMQICFLKNPIIINLIYRFIK